MTKLIYSIIAFGIPGGYEWIIILVIAVLIFGTRLPKIARNIGKSFSEFKKGIHDIQDDVTTSINEDVATANKTETKNTVN